MLFCKDLVDFFYLIFTIYFFLIYCDLINREIDWLFIDRIMKWNILSVD
jgi:hypothetical protein